MQIADRDDIEQVSPEEALEAFSVPIQPEVNKPMKLRLSPSEVTYLGDLEEKNRLLTMVLGDKVMEVEKAKAELEEHRKALNAAYVAALRMHGLSEGRINTREGTITPVTPNR